MSLRFLRVHSIYLSLLAFRMYNDTLLNFLTNDFLQTHSIERAIVGITYVHDVCILLHIYYSCNIYGCVTKRMYRLAFTSFTPLPPPPPRLSGIKPPPEFSSTSLVVHLIFFCHQSLEKIISFNDKVKNPPKY